MEQWFVYLILTAAVFLLYMGYRLRPGRDRLGKRVPETVLRRLYRKHGLADLYRKLPAVSQKKTGTCRSGKPLLKGFCPAASPCRKIFPVFRKSIF